MRSAEALLRAPLAVLVVGAAAACGGGGVLGQEQGGRQEAGGGGVSGVERVPPAGSSWEREIVPFPVLDEAGDPYEHPFLGGFDVPRPQLVDIDDDGDPDLFIQERSKELMFLENVGSAESPDFVWRTDRFADLDISEWYRFVDMDLDGDADLLAEQPFSQIRYYRNVGTASRPRFELAADTLRTVDGDPIYSDRQNIPNATDIDCDGLVDLFVGRLIGTVARYEAVERGARLPRFRLVTERFEEIEIVNALMGSLHGANTMDFADHDGDGDVDLFWGDFFEPGLLLLENTGSCRSPSISNDPVPFPPHDPIQTTGYNAPTVADLNGDGRPDMLMGVLGGAYNPTLSAADNLYHLEQTAAGFQLRTTRYLDAIDFGSETVPAFLDGDGDGDLDLFVGSKVDPDRTTTGLVHRFENVGSRTRPAFRYAGPLPVTGSYHYAPAAGDLDGDGAPDLVLGTWNDGVLYYRNVEGAADRWQPAADPLVTLTRGSHTTPTLGDLDGDGDLDLLVGEASGALNYFRNTGGGDDPSFELVSDEWLGIDVGRRSHPVLVDMDGDGDLDLVVANEDGELQLFPNRGTRSAPAFSPAPAEDPGHRLPAFPYAAPAFIDLDGDGALELVMGGLSGGLTFYRRLEQG